MVSTSRLFALLFWLVASGASVWSQEEHHRQEQPACDCADLNQRIETCGSDWQHLDGRRMALEQQVVDVEAQANERCQGQVGELQTQMEQVRREGQTQLEQVKADDQTELENVRSKTKAELERVQTQLERVRADGQTELENVRSETEAELERFRSESHSEIEQIRTESQAKLGQVESEGKAKLEIAQRLANEEQSQCQAKHQELNARVEEAASMHRSLHEVSSKLQSDLDEHKSAKTKLEKEAKKNEKNLKEALKKNQVVRKELAEATKTIEEMVAAKTIITIDYDLLNERVDEIKVIIRGHLGTFAEFMGEHFEFVHVKAVEGWSYSEKEIFPEVKRVAVEVKRVAVEDVIPFCKKSWKQATEKWEEVYAPYRGPVNKQYKETKKTLSEVYKENVEPLVKEYKLDQHAAVAKATAEDYKSMAHMHLVKSLKSSSKVALDFVKLEDGPEFAVEPLEFILNNTEKVAFYIEATLAFLVFYQLVKIIYGGRKKKKAKKARMAKKQQWEEKQKQQKEQVKNQKAGTNNKNSNKKNGAKHTKKNK